MSTVLLFSGGVDSYAAYHYLKTRNAIGPTLLYLEMGHRYQAEELKAIATLEGKGLISAVQRRSGFKGLGDVEHKDGFIAGRNAFLILAALELNPDTVVLTVQKDETALSDRNAVFFGLMSTLMSQQLGKPVTITTPFWDMDKTDMVWFLKNSCSPEILAGSFDTVACYRPKDGKPCNDCAACVRRAIAYANNDLWELDAQTVWRGSMMQVYLLACESDDSKYSVYRRIRTVRAIERAVAKGLYETNSLLAAAIEKAKSWELLNDHHQG